ncbi:MAG: hypothetical protein CMP81_15500 [Fulvimarina sp.]|nr:hypothetical protein [Fulvimarina sp.]
MADVLISTDSSTAQTLSAGDDLVVTQDSTLTTFGASAPITTTGGANQIAILGGLVGLSGQDALSSVGNSFLQFNIGSLGNVISTNSTALDIDGLTSAFEFSNAGSVQGDTDAVSVTSAVDASASTEFVNTGTIAASGDGLDVNSGGTVYATNGYGASIVSSNESAFEIQATRFELTNAGAIQGRFTAISVTPNTAASSAVPVYIFNDGSIHSSNADAIFVSTGNNTTISNNGLIAGENEGIQLTDGLGTATITNTGHLSGSNGNGIDASNTAVEINNTGVIASTDGIGLLLEDSTGSILNTSYINNSGTISSHVTSRSIDVVGDTAVEINNLGLITGGVRLSDVGDIIENGGTIGGDVELGAGDDLYDGFADSQVGGAVYGDAGNDDLLGGDNSDTLYGGSDNDDLSGGLGTDLVFGEDGNDRIIGDADAANDFYNGGANNDTITYVGASIGVRLHLGLEYALSAEIGFDRLISFETAAGGGGDDIMTASATTLTLSGNGGNDIVNGASGNNTLFGGSGDDTIRGFSGFDTIDGGSGNDTLTGDFNADTFVFVDGFGNDTITDFDEFNNSERINLAGVTAIVNFTDLQLNHLTQVGANAVITDGANTITLLNVNLADLDVNDFIF